METWIQVISVIIAATAAALSFFSAWQSRNASISAAEAARKIAETANKIAARDHDLYRREIKLQYLKDLRQWADETLHVMGDLIALCHLDPQQVDFNYRVRHAFLVNRLSILADRGRFFLPNWLKDRFGTEKKGAFRGARHKALDPLVRSFEIALELDCEGYTNQKDISKKLWNHRKDLIDRVQVLIKTEEWQQLIKELSDEEVSFDETHTVEVTK